MVEPETLNRLEHRRIFVAECGETIAGFLTLSPVALRNGWLFEQFPHRPGAPNGTVELMIDTAMRSLAAGGYEYTTLGLSPLSRRSDVVAAEQPFWLRMLLGWVRRHGSRFYNFDGLDAFKAKLRPTRWEPVFAVSNEPALSFRTLYAIASAFSGNAPATMAVGAIGKAAATELRWIKKRIW
jgi:phosphatidylglycerol lysyltransferase